MNKPKMSMNDFRRSSIAFRGLTNEDVIKQIAQLVVIKNSYIFNKQLEHLFDEDTYKSIIEASKKYQK